MNSIHFKPNEPQPSALKETAGVIDGFSVLYETWDGRLLSLPRPAAVKLNELDPAPGEEFSAIKRQESPKSPCEWVFALTARSEQLRAEREAAELAEQTKRDLAGQLQTSVLRQMPKSARKPSAEALPDPRGTGTYGQIPQVALAGRKTPPGRVSYRVALEDITRSVTGMLKEAGEQWNDQAKQDLISTAFISAAKSGGIVFDFEAAEGK